MKPSFVWLVLVAALLGGFLWYRTHPKDNLNVTPEAREQIEKAKRK